MIDFLEALLYNVVESEKGDKMLKTKRLELLKELVEQKKLVHVEECVQLLNTSESTVRRDLEELEKEGILTRVHGGAKYNGKIKDEPKISTKLKTNFYEKDLIAKHASQIVEDRDCIFLDAGSTTYNMIPYLADKDITVITNGITHIDRLIEYNIESYLVGGYIKPSTKAILGEEAVLFLQKYYFDKAFIGVNGISIENGFSTPDIRESTIKQVVISRTKSPYFLADHTKFDQSYFVKIADLSDCKVIVDQYIEKYKEHIKMEVAQ
ncbi:DeoR/GlpR family DNA-binding transcription regulator [Haloplasma contractile]|uniref:Transcriptional regulator DeoR family protein n=1 Tax=Haloplasma contractile SSD-17B TaxID=1033810 RepID=U2E094_9MOLU|nr:DeoR/GlpR family DNA-binding transcription regulator [Haloplasma contractile]ERJ13847.1 Transcriptional regulator DeoR family protein [Haloplasma contractile SSD-17B]